MNNKSTLISTLVIYGAIALILAPIYAAAFNPLFPIWLAILVGAAIGLPLLVIGLRLHPGAQSAPNDRIEGSGLPAPTQDASRQFWPTQAEVWGIVGLMTFFATVLLPWILFLPLFALLPAGDNWKIVIVRILLAAIAFGISYWWIEFARKKLPDLLRGKISDATIDSFVKTESPKEPGSTMEAVLKNWQLLVFGAVAFFVAYSVLNIKNPGPIVDSGPRRLRGIVRLLVWCRGNPNTVMSSSVLVGFGAMALYICRIIRAYVHSSRIDLRKACNK